MRRLSLVFLVAALTFSCGNGPTSPASPIVPPPPPVTPPPPPPPVTPPPPPPPPMPSDGDPYALAGAIFAPGMFPNMAEVTRYVRYTHADKTPNPHPTDSLTERYINWTARCDDLFFGSGFVADNIIAVEWVVRDSVRVDTLARYTAAPFDPLVSPIPGWGDDPDHMVRWSLRIDSLTPRAPLLTAFVASTMPGFSFTDPSKPIPQAAYCSQP